ncbi:MULTISPECIES: copper resistance protein CopC [unclassified Sinorhizobium]|uniref:copper resistance CopC family protein n=1 Tax=unclassified Sinorhizobium TaxID=2613772 RepID=UPI003524836D
MFKIILMACALALSLVLTTDAQARLETTIDDTPAAILRNVVLTFTAPVDADKSKVRVFTSSGREIATDELYTNGERTDLIAPISTPLSPGIYKVFWKAVSRDGQTVSGVSELTVPFEGDNRISQAPAP